MRPIDKGIDRGPFNPYSKAQGPLIEQIGRYCSYCERWVASAIHIEHKQPKSLYPDLKFLWSNFLLACSNCNSAKSNTLLNLDDYVWPDTDDTYRAFSYDSEGRVFPNELLNDDEFAAAKKTLLLVGLNKHPDTSAAYSQMPTSKDKRWLDRKQEWDRASRYYGMVQTGKVEIGFFLELIPDLVSKGQFSIWMRVFESYPEIKEIIINSFSNTRREFFDLADT